MTTSPTMFSFIKGLEQFTPSPYWDYGQYSWGYGTPSPMQYGTITKSQASNELRKHLIIAENAVNQYVTNKGVNLNQNQFDALVSLVYNVGSGNIFTKQYNNGYPKGSSLYNLILQGKFAEATLRFGDFVRAGGQVLNGLVERRAKEASIFSRKVIETITTTTNNIKINPKTKPMTTGILVMGLLGFLGYSLFKSNSKKV